MTSSPRERVLCRYHYDALDRLSSNGLPNSPERQRFYCKSRLATEIRGAMRYSIVQQGDLLLAQQRSGGDAPDTTLLATDQQRSALQTVKANHPPQPIAYLPYGHRSVESGLLSLLGFAGELPDPVTGYYLLGNGYRAFNPILMRFHSPDSLSPFEEGGLNTYAYCSGDPVNYVDPTGHLKILGPILKSPSTRKSVSLWQYVKMALRKNKLRTNQTISTPKPENPISMRLKNNETPIALLSERQVPKYNLSIKTPAKHYPSVEINRTNPDAPIVKNQYSLPYNKPEEMTHSQFRAENELFNRMEEMKAAIAVRRDNMEISELIRGSTSNKRNRHQYLVRSLSLPPSM